MMNCRKQRSAMTLVEVMVVVSIIGLLAAALFPAVKKSLEYKENSAVAHKLRTATQAFELYRSEEGSYPEDRTPGVTPPEMVDYFDFFEIDWWAEITEIGGKLDWDEGYHFAYSVSIHAPTRGREQLEDLDKMIDDGNLSSGKFRAVDDHYHYILEE